MAWQGNGMLCVNRPLSLPWARRPSRSTQALYAFKLLSETTEEQPVLRTSTPPATQQHSVPSFACSHKWDPSRGARYCGENTSVHNVHTRAWVSLQVGLLASLLHRVVPINEKWLIRRGLALGYRTVGLLFRGKSNHFCFLQFQPAWLSNNKSCYWHPELFLLGAGRLRNGRCLQGSGTQGSLLLTGAKKPEIALPTERCTISRQQRRERNGFRYKT